LLVGIHQNVPAARLGRLARYWFPGSPPELTTK